MCKKSLYAALFVLFFLTLGLGKLHAQYNNEWIDYSKTYYKFNVGQNGLYRIPYNALQNAGLSTTPLEQFQLWRNGREVAIYTSAASGAMSPNDFIEFYGVINDGKADAALYKKPEFQLADKWSLQTDTAAYFLTIGDGQHARVLDAQNNVAGNRLPADTYFQYTLSKNFREQINPGEGRSVSVYVYSSSYDNGEGWTSNSIQLATPLVDQYRELYVAPVGGDASLKVTAFGNTMNPRTFSASVNGNVLFDQAIDNYTAVRKSVTFLSSLLGRSVDTIRVTNNTFIGNDRMVLASYDLTYPRQFNFGGSSLFEFSLAGSSVGNFLEVSNFSGGSSVPILYDLSTSRRYLAEASLPGKYRFALPAGGTRNLVLINASDTAVHIVNALTQKVFTDFSQSANQSNYIMISHPSLAASSNGDALENYRAYRASVVGGSFLAKLYTIDELVDQFAYGIKKHPSAVKNFINYARNFFSPAPRYVLLIGKGITYDQYRLHEAEPIIERMNLVPTFGNPGSDNILGSIDNDPTAEISIGRISATTGDEVNSFLDKLKQHDQSLYFASNTVKEKAWMKNFAHIIGGGDPYLQKLIGQYMDDARYLVEDTSSGAHVYTFSKLSSGAVDQLNSGLLNNLYAEGLGVLTYFGHSSATTMEFNLNDPNFFNPQGKYPFFIANGCNVGNIFTNDTLRATAGKKMIAEDYLLIPNKGSIGFLASSHYGIVNYLNLYTNIFYRRMANEDYQSSVGDMLKNTMQELITTVGSADFYNVMTAEQITLGGDPAMKLYPHELPDYAIEDQFVKISPTPLTITNTKFDLKVKVYNLGKAIEDSVRVVVKRELPDGSIIVLYDKFHQNLYYADSIDLSVPINPTKERGENKIIVTIDPDELVQEITHANNNITKIFSIAEDKVRPIYPANFAIVNANNFKLTATTSQLFQVPKNFVVEVDTTEFFDSPYKLTQTQTSIGGIIDFSPVIPLKDSMVYYWRVARVPDTGTVLSWSNSSFVYLPQSAPGWNQSHYFQYQKDQYSVLNLNSSRQFAFDELLHTFKITSGVFPHFQNSLVKDLEILFTRGCGSTFGSLECAIIDQKTSSLKKVQDYGGSGTFGSIFDAPCNASNPYPFYFSFNSFDGRKSAISLFDSVPNSSVIIIYNWSRANRSNDFVDVWKNDTTLLGSEKSLYHKFKEIGFNKIDSFYRNVPFILIASKNEFGKWAVQEQRFGDTSTDILTVNYQLTAPLNSGNSITPMIGPAQRWDSLCWRGHSLEAESADQISYDVYGVGANFNETLLYSSSTKQQDTVLSFIDAKAYPHLKIYHSNKDSVKNSPWQLKYLQVKYLPPPEGALTPVSQVPIKDTIEVGEAMKINLAFKNITPIPFDSVKLYVSTTDASNTTKVLFDGIRKPLKNLGDTLVIDYTFDSQKMIGENSVYVNFNPNYAQPEQYLFNNYLNKTIFVKADRYAPNLDVTFDGLHILNKDIVSPKPTILVKLKDDSHYLALNDTSLFSVKLRYPDGTMRSIKFDNDTLQFVPSTLTPGGKDNTASVIYKPYLTVDGEYELIVTGKDRSNNASGAFEYRVLFVVYNKSMITNLLNYPNPFTSSTAFVFTLTGADLPSNLRIQILTMTGKIVKEINMAELGPLRIGNNITSYKWDGTDQYGQALANGVYLYRVITDIRGKKIEKLKGTNFNTDRYFQSGYGKMYLMR